MKTEKIVWGLTFVFVGSILLLDNFGIIDFYWRSVWHFWPVILILVGLNLVFGQQKKSTWGAGAMIALTCIVLGFIAYMGISHSEKSNSSWSWFFDGTESEADTLLSGNITFSEPFQPGTQRAKLHIEGGATSYNIKGISQQLFEAEVQRTFGQFSLEKISRDSLEELHFRMKGKSKNFDLDEVDANRADIRLHPDPIWDIQLELGAGQADFDLSSHKVESLQIKGGAAAFEVKLGMPVKETEVEVKAGMAEIKLLIPEGAGCQIELKGGMTGENFEGFQKQEDGNYTTPNFKTAAKKIMIRLKGGLSDFEVKRY